jgi:putative hydrolase of the HAD superfamily
MIKVYLFDWGDTLMVDFPDVEGKMRDWDVVKAVPGAKHALKILSKKAQIYIATAAANSSELDIHAAFERVGLSKYITGYFCKANVGFTKGKPEFLTSIFESLSTPLENIAMVGDNFEKDIQPAIDAGIQSFWFTTTSPVVIPEHVTVIKNLSELYEDL